eukprot:CAMPEP_0181364152 /NCGR_PEP_ID=MMETSP1106-20121128/9208_1 /TAXON_ID=81844 /ORGANISM="Mantoniella antarctica, Strain SL-175" /LENGTH=77 /DNA_ID=CAMNT_0023478795 /DNA_START=183 /DNA_END=416 /DNA_ORIENTATION=+
MAHTHAPQTTIPSLASSSRTYNVRFTADVLNVLNSNHGTVSTLVHRRPKKRSRISVLAFFVIVPSPSPNKKLLLLYE